MRIYTCTLYKYRSERWSEKNSLYTYLQDVIVVIRPVKYEFKRTVKVEYARNDFLHEWKKNNKTYVQRYIIYNISIFNAFNTSFCTRIIVQVYSNINYLNTLIKIYYSRGGRMEGGAVYPPHDLVFRPNYGNSNNY